MKKRIYLSIIAILVWNMFFTIAQEEENYVISLPGDQISPNVWGKYIVYLESLGNQRYDIYVYDSGNTLSKDDDVGVIKITTDGNIHYYSNPVINGRYIAWLDNNEDIYVYDMGDDGIINIGSDPGKKKLTLINTDPSEAYSYQAMTKENLEISSGVLVWEELELSGGDYDIRGYNLNVAGEANRVDPKDPHYLQIADRKSVTFGDNIYEINEKDPYIEGNTVVYVSDYYKDLGEFGVAQSREIFKTQLDNLAGKTMVSRDDDGCDASEPSAYFDSRQGVFNTLWVDSCPESRVVRNGMAIVGSLEGEVYHSPLIVMGGKSFYVKDFNGQYFLYSGEEIAGSEIDADMGADKYQLVYILNNDNIDIGLRGLKLSGGEECIVDCPSITRKYCSKAGNACEDYTSYTCQNFQCNSGAAGGGMCMTCTFGCNNGECLKVKSFIRADIDNSGALDITDAITLLSYLFQAGKEPTCFDAADVDDSGILDLTDAIYLLQRLFQGGAEIPEPRALGVDPTSEGLDCKCYGASC